MPRNPGLVRNPRPTSARNIAIAIAIGVAITIPTGATAITGRITGATTTMPRAATATTVPAITAAVPASPSASAAAAIAAGNRTLRRDTEAREQRGLPSFADHR